MYCIVISNMVSHLEVLQCEKVNTAKEKDGLTSYLMLTVLALFHMLTTQ